MPTIRQMNALQAAATQIGNELGMEVELVPEGNDHFTVRIGSTFMHQVNAPAAVALLDGVLIGAAEVRRQMVMDATDG